MDKIDSKILHALSEDARESRKVLAKKVGVSREVFDYRVKRLEEEKIITGYQARINLSNFTYGSYLLLIQSSGSINELEKELVAKLKPHSMTHYISRIGGNYDFLISFSIKESDDILGYINSINSAFGKNKSKMTVLTMIEELKDSFKVAFSDKNEMNDITSRKKLAKKIDLDDKDKKILSLLGKDGRMYSPKIAEKIKMTEVAARKRMNNLVDKRIILNFRTMIDFTKVGLQAANIFFKINSANSLSETRLKSFFQQESKVFYACRIVGEYDYIIAVLTKDNKELNEYISWLREEFKEVMSEINICPTFELLHHNYITEEFFD